MGSTLNPGEFFAGPNVLGSLINTDRIVYDTINGNLFFDPDGSGPLASIRFATLSTIPLINSADVLVSA